MSTVIIIGLMVLDVFGGFILGFVVGDSKIKEVTPSATHNKASQSASQIADEIEICVGCTPELSKEVVKFLSIKVQQLRALQ